MSLSRWRRKLRTREHVIAEMAVNFVERQVLRRGHQLIRVPGPEYGTDAMMLHFSPETGEIENGRVEFQVKATDHVSFVDGGKFVRCFVESAHVHYWIWEIPYPMVLVLYDARKNRAYWVDIHAYGRSPGFRDSRKMTIRIPVRNVLGVQAIDHFRKMSLASIANVRPLGENEHDHH